MGNYVIISTKSSGNNTIAKINELGGIIAEDQFKIKAIKKVKELFLAKVQSLMLNNEISEKFLQDFDFVEHDIL